METKSFISAIERGGFMVRTMWTDTSKIGHHTVTKVEVYGHPGEFGRPLLTAAIIEEHSNRRGLFVYWQSQSPTIPADLRYLRGLEAAYLENARRQTSEGESS